MNDFKKKVNLIYQDQDTTNANKIKHIMRVKYSFYNNQTDSLMQQINHMTKNDILSDENSLICLQRHATRIFESNMNIENKFKEFILTKIQFDQDQMAIFIKQIQSAQENLSLQEKSLLADLLFQADQIAKSDKTISEKFNLLIKHKQGFEKKVINLLVNEINLIPDAVSEFHKETLDYLKKSADKIQHSEITFSEKKTQLKLMKNNFNYLNQTVSHPLKTISSYHGARLTAEIQIAIKDACFLYCQNDERAEQEPISHTKQFRDVTYKHYKEYSAPRFFRRYQPQSRLVTQFDIALNEAQENLNKRHNFDSKI